MAVMLEIRIPTIEELPEASRLCIRSKAYWGYDKAFMQAVENELTVTENDLVNDEVAIAVTDGDMLGLVQVSASDGACYLEKLFVDPDHLGCGVGKAMFKWSVVVAHHTGCNEMIVEADPQAVQFYIKVGCIPAGNAPSASISGRTLPRLIFPLTGV